MVNTNNTLSCVWLLVNTIAYYQYKFTTTGCYLYIGQPQQLVPPAALEPLPCCLLQLSRLLFVCGPQTLV